MIDNVLYLNILYNNIMRLVLLLFSTLLFTTELCAQSTIEAVNPSSYIQGSPDELMTHGFDIKNNGDSPITVLVRRNVISEVEGSFNYFCWFQCYAPDTDVSPSGITINAGESVANFYADYQPNGNEGSSVIEYCFFNQNDPSEETCVTIEFNADAALSTDEFKERIVTSEFYPNPASTSTQIEFNLRDKNEQIRIVVYNVVGSELESRILNGNDGLINIDLSNFESGIYLCSFVSRNNVLLTKKLVVE